MTIFYKKGPVAESALHRSGEAARAAVGRRGQVPRPAQVPAAADHLGRRGDELLFQREISFRPARLVRPQSVPVAQGEARTGRSFWTDHHPSVELVQKPAAKGQGSRAQRQVSYILCYVIIGRLPRKERGLFDSSLVLPGAIYI